MAKRDLGTGSTFDIVASGKKTQARVVRRQVTPLAIGAVVTTVGIAVGGRLGSGITLCGLFLLVRAVEPARVRRWLKQLRGAGRHAQDYVDQASWESFPASDSPAFSPVGAVR